MENLIALTELILDDELVNDFEFAERLYSAGLKNESNNFYLDNNLIWED